jgi:predicted small secreted protein
VRRHKGEASAWRAILSLAAALLAALGLAACGGTTQGFLKRIVEAGRAADVAAGA